MGMEAHDGSGEEEAPRPPRFTDLSRLSAEFNRLGARYVVVGGFALIQHGFQRFTNDIDFLVETTPANEARVLEGLLILPDKAAAQLKPGEIGQFGVVRVADEVMVDLLKSGCGVTYDEAIRDAVVVEVDGVRIPFASASSLWRMKQAVRDKDVFDRKFLDELLSSQGIRHDPTELATLENPLARLWQRFQAWWRD